jgi:LacI family transcriptional regulator
MVFVDRAPGRIVADCVLEDDFGGAHLATTHLLRHGHDRIAFVGDSLRASTTMHRLEGYTQALTEEGIAFEERLTYLGENDPVSMEQALLSFAGLARPPTAVFSSNARCTLAVFSGLQRVGGKGMALVSFGDFPMAASLRPSVTVVDQDPTAVGKFAAERLFIRIGEPTKRLRRRTVLPVSLIERASCAKPVGADGGGSRGDRRASRPPHGPGSTPG